MKTKNQDYICYPDSYTYYANKNEVTAMARFKGQRVKAKAVCSPNDTYDVTIGVKLATARLNAKLAAKRRENAIKEYNETHKLRLDIEEQEHKKAKQVTKWIKSEEMATEQLTNLLKQLKAPKDNYLY